MLRRAHISFVLLLLVASGAWATDRTDVLLARAWPAAPYASLDEIGAGVGVVFSPDLSVPGNCKFYNALGFGCFETPDWHQVIEQIGEFNEAHPGRPIRTLILETHGTNGNGLKLQKGKEAEDPRSYISVAALQENLDPLGVRYVIISACNSARLLRPEIYRELDPNCGDKLFLPASLGIINASPWFSSFWNHVTIITPATSHIETTLVGSLRELAPTTRTALTDAANERSVKLPKQFAISEMMIEMLIRDPDLQLRTGRHDEDLSRDQTPPDQSERLFSAFVAHLNFIAAREKSTQSASSAAATK